MALGSEDSEAFQNVAEVNIVGVENDDCCHCMMAEANYSTEDAVMVTEN